MRLTPAETLDDVYDTLFTQPLIDPDKYDAFYRFEINEVRGSDKVAFMARRLEHCHQGAFYRTFLMGHSGVGKSTEMTRLSRLVKDKYNVIRVSAQTDLDAGGFKPFDVLLAMMIKLVEETAKPVSENGTGKEPSPALLAKILQWFATEKSVTTRDMATGVSAAAGLKPSPVTWGALLGLFAEIKGEIKYTSDRKQEITDYRLNAISSLIDLLNALLGECNDLLRQEAKGREWLIIGEDFDKPGIPKAQTESLFINYSNIFSALQTHLIFNIPVALAYSEKGPQLSFKPFCILDTPVYHKDHTPHIEGRTALKTVLEARIVPALFEDGQMTRLIVASGGNLRDLFEMTFMAADNAAIRLGSTGKIADLDVTYAVNSKRTEYYRRLGQSPFDEQGIGYEVKAQRLVDIYEGKSGSDATDPTLHSLLRARAVQEFNGEGWFSVHPLVVDTLISQDKIAALPSDGEQHQGKPLGGTL